MNWFKLVWIMWSFVHGCPPQTPPPGQSQAANFTAGLEKFFAQTRADYSTCSLNEAVAALHCLCPVHICSPRCSLWCVFNWCRNWHLSSCPCICSSILYLSLKRWKAKATANYTKQTHQTTPQTIDGEKAERKPAILRLRFIVPCECDMTLYLLITA